MHKCLYYLVSPSSAPPSSPRSRKQSLAKAKELLAAGDSKGAYLQIQRAVDVTPQMAARLMHELRRHRIDFVVAPYEADAQMAWLARNDRVAAIITEDSDLLLFGAPRILFKLDRDGYADEVCISRLPELVELDMSMLSFEQFRQVCILSGCDYLPPIYGMGLKTAHRYVCRYRSIGRILQVLRAELPPGRMPFGYEAEFAQAELTFIHQRVYDMEARTLCHLNPLPVHQDGNGGASWDFLGPTIADIELVRRICEGHVCPNSWEPFGVLNEEAPDTSSLSTCDEPLTVGKAPECDVLPFQIHLDKHVVVERITLKRSLTVATNTVTGLTAKTSRHQRFAYSTASVTQDPSTFAHIPKAYTLGRRGITSREQASLLPDTKQRSIRDYFKRPASP